MQIKIDDNGMVIKCAVRTDNGKDVSEWKDAEITIRCIPAVSEQFSKKIAEGYGIQHDPRNGTLSVRSATGAVVYSPLEEWAFGMPVRRALQ